MAASRCWRVPCFHIYHSFVASLLHFVILLSAYNISESPIPPALHNNSLNDNQPRVQRPSNHSVPASSQDPDQGAVNFPTMVFLVGFHKCGTRTTASFFRKNGFPAVHNDNFNGHYHHHGEPTLRQIMQENYC